MDTPTTPIPISPHLAAMIPVVIGLAFMVRQAWPAVDGKRRVLVALMAIALALVGLTTPIDIMHGVIVMVASIAGMLRDALFLMAAAYATVSTADRVADRAGAAVSPAQTVLLGKRDNRVEVHIDAPSITKG